MTRTSAIALILSATFALAGCDETETCPAPTAEPAKATASAAAVLEPAAPVVAKASPAAAVTSAPKVATPVQAAEPAVDVDAELYVKRLVIARGVKDREPVDPASTFAKSDGKRIYAFVEVGNKDLSASEITVSFKPKNGAERGRIELRVGASPRWRTWAYTELAQDVGEWEAIVRDARGDIIGKQSFAVTDLPLTDDPYADMDKTG